MTAARPGLDGYAADLRGEVSSNPTTPTGERET